MLNTFFFPYRRGGGYRTAHSTSVPCDRQLQQQHSQLVRKAMNRSPCMNFRSIPPAQARAGTDSEGGKKKSFETPGRILTSQCSSNQNPRWTQNPYIPRVFPTKLGPDYCTPVNITAQECKDRFMLISEPKHTLYCSPE